LHLHVWACICRSGLHLQVWACICRSGLVFAGQVCICRRGLYLLVWACSCRSGLVFACLGMCLYLVFPSLGLYLQVWACICRSGMYLQVWLVFAALGLYLQVWVVFASLGMYFKSGLYAGHKRACDPTQFRQSHNYHVSFASQWMAVPCLRSSYLLEMLMHCLFSFFCFRWPS
jgi:hypothetical protein